MLQRRRRCFFKSTAVDFPFGRRIAWHKLSIELLAFLWCADLFSAPASTTNSVNFQYSPPEWQTSICLPDDPYKSLVDRSGELLYHYNQAGREFGTRIGVEVGSNAVWERQELVSPRVPIVRTLFSIDKIQITEEAFAVIPPSESRANEANQSSRNDLFLVQVHNTSSEARAVRPYLVVDTVFPFKLDLESQRAQVNDFETITSSLEMIRLDKVQGSRHTVELSELIVPASKSVSFCILYSGGAKVASEPATLKGALAARGQALQYWRRAPLPYGRIEVPDTGIQALVDSSIRNIWQAREMKKGLPAFQVGPTCYRGLWIVDGAFLLESAALLGAGKEARNGVAYELTYQRPDGSIHVMDNYSKENGIVLWTCVRHAQLTQDKAWLENQWPKLERIAQYIKALRQQTLTNSSPRDDGLLPAGFPDGGIGGVIDEYTNPYWNMAGLHAFVQAAHWLDKAETAATWQTEYDDFMAAFKRAAQRDMKTDALGYPYLPVRMDGQDLPQRGQWAFCHAVYPGQIFDPQDPFVSNMLKMLEGTEREGMVYGTGWDPNGIWNYFASFYAHAWLWQGNGPKAAQVLEAFANHAAPTLVWREEQSLRGEKFKKVGDMPHNWASAEFIRLMVHLLAIDRGDELHLLEGLPSAWTGPKMQTRLNGIATPFGPLYMNLQVDNLGTSATLSIKSLSSNCKAVVVHLPNGELKRVSAQRAATIHFGL